MSSIIKFDKYHEFKSINENVTAAKQYTARAIQNGLIEPEFFDRSKEYSGFNVIIKALGKNLGYAYYFIKQYIDNLDKYDSVTQYTREKVIPILEKINALKAKNKYTLNINDKKYINAPIEVFEKDLNTLYTYVMRPGIVLDEDINIRKSSLFKTLMSILNNIDYKVVIAVKKEGGKFVTDEKAIYYWASPAWCLKSPNHFSNYIKNNNYIQYIFIHKDVYNEVVEAQSKGTNIPDEEKKVPINWESYKRTEALPGFKAFEPYIKRIGITTPPIESTGIKNILSNMLNITTIPFDSFNDKNISLDKKEVIDLTNLSAIDTIVRKILKVSNSAFDIGDIKVDSLLNIADVDTTIDVKNIFKEIAIDSDITDDLILLTDAINKMYIKVIKPYKSILKNNKKLVSEIIFKSIQDDLIFFVFQSFILTLSYIPDELMNKLKTFYYEPIDEEYKTFIPFTIIPIYLDLRNNNNIENEDLIALIDETLMYNFLIKNTVDSFSFDYITAITDDFKTVLLTVEHNGKSSITFKYPGLFSNALTVGAYKMTADYIYLFRHNLIEEFKNKYNWNTEINFITKFIKYARDTNEELTDFAAQNVEFLLNKIYSQLETVMFIDTRIDLNPKLIKAEMLRQLKAVYEKIDFYTNHYTPEQHNIQLLYCMQGFFSNYEKGKEMYNNYFNSVL